MRTQEFFKFLPSEVNMSILSKLPVQTIMICKCVCKSWLHLLETEEFVKLHLSVSLPGLVTFQAGRFSSLFNFFEVEDDGRDVDRHDLHYNLVTSFSFPRAEWILGSVDGLLWLRNQINRVDVIYACNPVTREYTSIHSPPEFPCTSSQWETWGFGSCKTTGEYKAVRILLNIIFDKETHRDRVKSVAECHVYTLGIGSVWRRLAPCALPCGPIRYNNPGAFVNGNLHWLGYDSEGRLCISCLDLETESFSNFSAPPLEGGQQNNFLEILALEETLFLVNTTHGNAFVIWLMEEYGVAESWTKILVIINKKLGGGYDAHKLHPLKVFKDGDILMEINYSKLFYYSSKTKTVREVDKFKGNSPYTRAICHTPSFLSLKSLGMENVNSF